MKQAIFTIMLFLHVHFSNAQEPDEFVQTDKIALGLPSEMSSSTADIAAFLMKNFKTDAEKLRAAYIWVTANIKYDRDSMYFINAGADSDAKINVALKRRKGVCENYAAIFNDIAVKAGCSSFVVAGYTRQSAHIDKTGHSWCAVHTGNGWFFCDPTWDEGTGTNKKYFMISPSAFIKSHIPFDPIWQLLNEQVSYNDFDKGNFYFADNIMFTQTNDSIKAFLSLDDLGQLEASAKRILRAGIVNELVKTRRAYIQMQIHLIYENKDRNFFNEAVSDFNKANTVFVEFIAFRNNQFKPAKADADLLTLLEPANAFIEEANNKIEQVGKFIENLQWDTEGLKKRLCELRIQIAEQKIFIERYITTTPAERIKLFYK